jgi:ABC-type uncharacterized transport system substrate-binding protein
MNIVIFHYELVKKCSKSQYDCKVHPHVFHEGNLTLVYDEDHVLGVIIF